MYQLIELTPISAVPYQSLLHPKHHEILRNLNGSSAWAIGAVCDGRPVGLAAGHCCPAEQRGEILSLTVADIYQKRGIGRALLRQAEQKLQEKNSRLIHFSSIVKAEDLVWLDAFLRKEQWNPLHAQIHMYTLGMKDKHLSKIPWLSGLAFPEGFSTCSWGELTTEERERVEQGYGSWYPPVFSPFIDEHKIDLHYSLGLRFQGDVIGWMIVQRLASNLLLYKTLFVQKQFQHKARGITLLAEAIRNTFKTFPFGICFIENENKSMLQLINRRLEPFILYRKLSVRTSKEMGG